MLNGDGNPLRQALRQCRRGLWLVLGFGLMTNLLFLAVPLYLVQIFDRVLASQRVETLVMLTLMAAFSLLVLGILEAIRGRMLVRIGNWLESAVTADVVRANLRAALDGTNSSAQAMRDLNALRHFLIGGTRVLLDLPWMPLFLAAVCLLDPALGALAIGAALVLLLLPTLGLTVTYRSTREASAARVANEAFAEQVARTADTIQAMRMLPRFLDILLINQRRIRALNQRIGDTNSILFSATRFARLLAQISILALGAYLSISGDLTPGAIVAASILMGRALAPAEQSVAAWNDIANARNAYARLRRLLEGTPAGNAAMPVLRPSGALSADGIWYSSPRSSEPTLWNIGFSIAPGEVMAVVGPSASGKSTLCKVLVGAWRPTKGKVRLSGADVHAEWPSEQLGAQIGYVAQEIEFFTGTVRQNIARLARDPDADAVVAAAEAASVHELILALPQGYDTVIGPGGHPLSHGQRKRVALARALFGQPRLIVLDEPDSNLDGTGEIALAKAIQGAARWQSAVVFVTYNPRLLPLADRILVLNQGRVRFYGHRDDVLRRLLPEKAAANVARLRDIGSATAGNA